MLSKVQRANDTANVATICTVNKGSRKMMQAERGIRQHGGPVALVLVRRNGTACTDAAARVSHREAGLVDERYDSCPNHMSKSCMRTYARPTRCMVR